MPPRDPATASPAGETATMSRAQDAMLLRTLAERVRGARARRGMTRRRLARDSGVSERYLAQLESAQGNASVLVLNQVARALGLPVGDLLREFSSVMTAP